MNLTQEQHGNVVVVTFHGDVLDARNVKEFRQAMDPILEQHDTMILDMSEITFVDSSGLGSLLDCLRKLTTDRDGRFDLCSLTRPVRTLFEMVRIHRIFEIHNTREDALQRRQKKGADTE
ncbi:MAG: STAS domain-containing protein [Parcubacteria group bacterium]|nr:STAS domain-containing protein [Parcubacteria group bacterium]